MAKSIANLAITLSANISKFTTGMNKAIKPVKKFGTSVAKAGFTVAKFGVAAGSVAAAGLSLMVKGQLAAIDSTTKFADLIGIATEDLVGLQKAASLSGVKVEALQMGLQRMTRRIAEAAQGTGEAKNALLELGLDAAKLAAAGPDEAFKQIADAMQKVPTQADRVRLAMKLFDSEGVSLIRTMTKGRKGIEEFQAKAELLGLTVTRIDAAKVEAANDSFSDLGDVLTGVGRTLAIKLAPFIEAANQKIIDMAVEGKGVGNIVTNAFEKVAKGIAVVSDWLDLLKAAFKGARAAATFAIFGIAKALDFLIKKQIDYMNFVFRTKIVMTDFFDDFADNLLVDAEKALDEATEAMDRFTNSAASGEVSTAFKKIRADAEAAAKAIADAAAGKGPTGVPLPNLDALKAIDKLMARGKSLTESLRTPLEVFEDTIGDLSKLLNAGAIDWETYGRAFRKASKDLKDAETPKITTTAAGTGRFADVAVGIGGPKPTIKVEGQKEQLAISKQIELNTRPNALVGGGATFN